MSIKPGISGNISTSQQMEPTGLLMTSWPVRLTSLNNPERANESKSNQGAPALVLPHLKCLMKKKVYNYDGCPVFLETAHYRNNNTLAVIMFSADGGLYGDVTVNLSHPMLSKRMAFFDENNMPEIGNVLRRTNRGSL